MDFNFGELWTKETTNLVIDYLRDKNENDESRCFKTGCTQYSQRNCFEWLDPYTSL